MIGIRKSETQHTHTYVCIYDGILFNHKEDEILTFATKQIQLEIIMLSEINLTQKKNITFSLSCGSYI